MAPRKGIESFQEIPNVGPVIASDLFAIGMEMPSDLIGKDPYTLYDRLCRVKGARVDPCVIDIFIAAVRYMEGAPAKKWWHYTAERKQHLENREKKA